jgi:hypothetical protein
MEIMQIENDGTSPHRGGVEVRVCGAGELRLSPMLRLRWGLVVYSCGEGAAARPPDHVAVRSFWEKATRVESGPAQWSRVRSRACCCRE